MGRGLRSILVQQTFPELLHVPGTEQGAGEAQMVRQAAGLETLTV